MRILFEGAKYDVKDLKECFGDRFYHQKSSNGYIDVVGYFHSDTNELYYFLPKLFITTDDCFLDTGLYYLDFFKYPIESLLKHDITLLNWFRKFLILFYKSLKEYNNRVDNNIVQLEETLQLSTNIGKNEYTFLDLVLTILNFYKKNKDFFVFYIKQIQAKKHRKVNWSKTVREQQPIFVEQIPIYDRLNNKVKTINTDEILMIYFYSVLNYLKDEYKVDLAIDCPYILIKGDKFKDFLENGYHKLKKIRNNYFSDKLREIYALLYLFLEKTSRSSVKAHNDDFIIVKQYHHVFEDMIDKLLSDSFSEIKTSNGVSLQLLKNNQDGKIIDHLFEYENLLDDDESIFYIGDSKYYKHNSTVGVNSVYKQFTYAKNVIQFNIDLLHENAKIPSLLNKCIRYRDEVTEGYSVSPNFFIQGVIGNIVDFENDRLTQNLEKGTEKSAHFKERLFDRDTLIIKYYEINFLFVMNAYTNFSSSRILELRLEFKRKFKEHFQSYFRNHSEFDFYEFIFRTESDLRMFVDAEFRYLTGRILRTISQPRRLIVAINPKIEQTLGNRNLLNKFSVKDNSNTHKKEFCYKSDSTIEFFITEYIF